MHEYEMELWRLKKGYIQYANLGYAELKSKNVTLTGSMYEKITAAGCSYDFEEFEEFFPLMLDISWNEPVEIMEGDVLLYCRDDTLKAYRMETGGFADVSEVFAEMLYFVEITETLVKRIATVAVSSQDALRNVNKRYMAEDIILTADDFIGVDMAVQ